MWHIGLRNFLVDTGATHCLDLLLQSLLILSTHFGCWEKSNYKQVHSSSLFLAMENIFPQVSGGPSVSYSLIGKRYTLTKLGTTLAMSSFSAPIGIQLLVTTREPIKPSPIGKDQRLWEDKLTPRCWDKGIPWWTHQLVRSSLPSRSTWFQTGNNIPSKRSSERTSVSNK